MVGSSLNDEEKTKTVSFFRANNDVFAWQPYDLLGIDAEVMCHRLHIDNNFKPIKQNPRKTAPEKARAVEEEIHKLLKARAIRKAQFYEWIF